MNENFNGMTDFDDLLFEFRNKEYGAYRLRKGYKTVLVAGIFLTSVFFSLLVLLPFLFRPDSERVIGGGLQYVNMEMDNLNFPEEIYVPPPPPPPQQSVAVQEAVKYVPPVVVDTVPIYEKNTLATDEFLAQTTTEQLDISGLGSGSGDDLLSSQFGIPSDEPFFQVEVMPAFRGGDLNKFREWVQRRTTYPQIAIDKKIKGRVFLTFIVEPDGNVTNVTVVRGVDPLIDVEAIKAIQASPKWSPGLQRGKPVRVRFSMSLYFAY